MGSPKFRNNNMRFFECNEYCSLMCSTVVSLSATQIAKLPETRAPYARSRNLWFMILLMLFTQICAIWIYFSESMYRVRPPPPPSLPPARYTRTSEWDETKTLEQLNRNENETKENIKIEQTNTFAHIFWFRLNLCGAYWYSHSLAGAVRCALCAHHKHAHKCLRLIFKKGISMFICFLLVYDVNFQFYSLRNEREKWMPSACDCITSQASVAKLSSKLSHLWSVRRRLEFRVCTSPCTPKMK